MDDKIYFIRDNEQQIPVYDFIKAMDPDAVSYTHLTLPTIRLV